MDCPSRPGFMNLMMGGPGLSRLKLWTVGEG